MERGGVKTLMFVPLFMSTRPGIPVTQMYPGPEYAETGLPCPGALGPRVCLGPEYTLGQGTRSRISFLLSRLLAGVS
jgi:hypothetical protein